MKYKYFEIINGEKFLNLQEEEMFSLLEEKGLLDIHNILNYGFPSKERAGIVEIYGEITPEKGSSTFIQAIGLEMYKFLLLQYSRFIGTEFLLFRKKIETETFGFSNDQKREIGLQYFNLYFYECCNESDQQLKIVNEGKNLGGIESRFITLLRKKESLIYELRGTQELILSYLFGDLDFFNRELVDKSALIRKILILENNYEKLRFLNDQFQFETELDDFDYLVSHEVYKRHHNEFDSIKVVQFIERTLYDPAKKKRAYVLALFKFLNESDLINLTSILFCKICNDNFECKLKDLDLGSTSVKFFKNIKKLNEEWVIFNS